MNPACEHHRPLVDRVLDGQPSDDDLIAYAEDVPGCADCRQALMVANRVHPSVLEQGGADPADVAWLRTTSDPGMERLAEELEQAPRAPIPLVPAAVAVALVALALLAIRPTQAPEPIEPPPVPEVAAAAPAPEPPAPQIAPAPRIAPAPPVAPVAPPDPTDAVADAATDDWDPPAWQDLRGATPKGLTGATTIDLVRPTGAQTVQSTWPLTAITSAPSAVTLCVRGPERGVVWRGQVPAGRTPLAQDGQPVGYVFSEPGTYKFLASLADDPTCADPAWLLSIEVAP